MFFHNLVVYATVVLPTNIIMDEFQNMDKSIGFHLGHTFRMVKSVMNKVFQENGYNITSDQWQILMCLWGKDGKTQQEVTQFVTKEKATVTRLIDGLEKRNLFIRVQDKTDRRKNLLYLTDEAKQLKDKLMPIATKTLDIAVKGFEESEIEMLKSLLIRVQENLKVFEK